jgi:hypothetical protein
MGMGATAGPRRHSLADSPQIAALAGHVRAGRCALFVGAGLSRAAGLPTWGELIDAIVEAATPWAAGVGRPASAHGNDPETIRRALGDARAEALCRSIGAAWGQGWDGPARADLTARALDIVLHDTRVRAELRALATARRFAELAGHCRDLLGRDVFHAEVRRLLRPTRDLPATHRAIVRTPFSCVITTNFDTLLEEAFAHYGGQGVPRAPTGAELTQHGTLLLDRGFFVLKAHGDAARPDTMVFTADDYRRVIHANPAFQSVLGGILLTNAVLFVGYSLSDTNFRLLLDNHLTIFEGNVPPRYAIMEDVGPAESEILWKTARLQVLSYPKDQHGEVERCLVALAGLVAAEEPASQPDEPAIHPRDPFTTLSIGAGDGHLLFELIHHRPGGAPTSERTSTREWIGSGPVLDTRAMGPSLRLANETQARGPSPRPVITEVGDALAGLLPPPLQDALDQLPPGGIVEIACSAAVTRVPWEWTSVAGGPLALRYAVVRRPTEVTHQARGRRAVGRPLHALILGDSGGADEPGLWSLPFAEWEADVVARLLTLGAPDAVVTRLSRETATHRNVVRELERRVYDVIHFCGHAWFDTREAYFYLWDRIMLGSELAPLLSRRPPALLVLDTHYTAFLLAEIYAGAEVRELVGGPSAPPSVATAGGARGFAEAAMRCGVTSFVGTFGDVQDRTCAELAVAFYAGLMTGLTVPEALRAAREQTTHSTFDAGLVYSAHGYPDFRLVPTESASPSPLSAASLLETATAQVARPGGATP